MRNDLPSDHVPLAELDLMDKMGWRGGLFVRDLLTGRDAAAEQIAGGWYRCTEVPASWPDRDAAIQGLARHIRKYFKPGEAYYNLPPPEMPLLLQAQKLAKVNLPALLDIYQRFGNVGDYTPRQLEEALALVNEALAR